MYLLVLNQMKSNYKNTNTPFSNQKKQKKMHNQLVLNICITRQ